MKLKWKQKRMDGDAYMEKVSTMALCSLTYQLSRKQQKSFKNKVTVDAHWVCMITAPIMPIPIGMFGSVYTYTVWASALLDLE